VAACPVIGSFFRWPASRFSAPCPSPSRSPPRRRPHQARCDVASSLSIRTLDGDDTITNGTAVASLLRADLDGATGDDGSSEDGPAGARDTIAADVENLEGTRSDDVLIGNAGPNVIDGSGGHDQVQGLGGDDQITAGGAGSDFCTSDTRLVPGTPDKFLDRERTVALTPF
jgi:Ca2+-binding RTX toxin-like protein